MTVQHKNLKPINSLIVRTLKRVWRSWPDFCVPYKLPWGIRVFLRQDGTSFGLLDGTYPEQEELHWIQQVLKPGMVFFDIGANLGIYSLTAAKAVSKTGHVYSFEPVPSALKKLESNVRLNSLNNVTIARKAIGNQDGSVSMYACIPLKDGFSSIARPHKFLDNQWNLIDVNITTLDMFTKNVPVHHIDYIKIDVEGGEIDVLKGAQKILTNSDPPIIQAEFSDRRSAQWNYKSVEIGKYLEKLGFIWFELIQGKLSKHTLLNTYTKARNLIAVPEKTIPQIQNFIASSSN